MFDISIRIKDKDGAEQSIELSPCREPDPRQLSIEIAGIFPHLPQQPIKIRADGSHLPASATDHVAVLFPSTGLMWAVKSLGGSKGVKQKDAAAQLKGFDLLRHTDWRLPEISELLTIVDYSKNSPAIDSALFPDTKSDWYWTNTAYAGSPSVCAWFVSFYNGNSGYGSRVYNDGFVRAVRSVSPSQ